MKKAIKIIDLFAGPGGLGEGFSSCLPSKKNPFQIAMSVEFEKNAHKTLTLRALYRQLSNVERTTYYYPYIRSQNISEKNQQFERLVANCEKQWHLSLEETLGAPHALGNQNKWKKIKDGVKTSRDDNKPTDQEKRIFGRITEITKSHKGPTIVIGGAPCQAYSVNGRNRQRAEKDYDPSNDERFFLYLEYLKVLDKVDPAAFVMENVEGILTAELASGERIFKKIKEELTRPSRRLSERYDIYSLSTKPSKSATRTKGPQYETDNDYVLTASDYGVPQDRKRVILFGIKKKYGPIERTLVKTGTNGTPSTEEMIGCLPTLRSGLNSKHLNDTSEDWSDKWSANRDSLLDILSNPLEIRKVVKRWVNQELARKKARKLPAPSKRELRELRRQFEADIRDSYGRTVRELKNFQNVTHHRTKSNDGKGNDFFIPTKNRTRTFSKKFEKKYPDLFAWLCQDTHLGGVINHRTRRHMESDLKRYMFSAAWAKAHSELGSPSPKSKHYPFALSPKHKNWESGAHSDRFRTIEASVVPSTITSHLKKDGHAQIHYDARQNRSMTVREAARIQTFPDDYYFEGPQGAQFQQVGNAVPAFLARTIALFVLDIMKEKKIIK